MSDNELLPYFHPTQIILVDDDIDFLGNLSLQLDADLAYLLFDSTEKALDFVNDRKKNRPSRLRFFDLAQDQNLAEASDPPITVRIDADAVMNEMYHADRFSQLSVVMVDYAMPRLNGIELCRRIEDPNIKKILFTGVATETQAVEAFNQGIIDHYIRKSEHRVYDKLNATIRSLQHQHIQTMFDAAGEVFDIGLPPILSNPPVRALMHKLAARYRYVEYYLAARPAGFMLIDADGHVHRLVLADADTVAEQRRLASDFAAPQACIDALSQGEAVMNPVMLNDDTTTAQAFSDWPSHSLPAAPLAGDRRYHWAVFEHPSARPADQPPVATLNNYLDWVDTVGYSLM